MGFEIQEKSLLRWALDILAVIVWSPCHLPPVLLDLARGRHISPPVVESPVPRKRALTLPLAEKPVWGLWRKHKTKQQSECLFFNRLPPEIRLQIYHLALGNKTVRIWRSKDGLQHTSALTEDLMPRLMEINGCIMPRWHRWRNPERIVREKGNLALLLTCRKIYSEAIETLYSGNTIRLLDNNYPAFHSPHLLQQMILPERFCVVRSLEIPITLTTMQSYLQYHIKELAHASESWEGPLPQNTWDVLVTMRGLRKLRIRFQCKLEAYVENEEGIPAPTEENLLKPLLKLDWIPDFCVEVSWPANQDSERILQNAPFRVVRKCDEEVEAYYEKTWW